MNGKTEDSLILLGYIYSLRAIRTHHEQLVYICQKYDVRLLCAQFLCWWWARVTSSLRTYNAMENWDLISSFVQLKSYGYLWVKHKCSVRFYISQRNRSDCFACPTATEHAYGKRTSYQNRKMLLRVSQDFHFICRGTYTYEQSWLCLTPIHFELISQNGWWNTCTFIV